MMAFNKILGKIGVCLSYFSIFLILSISVSALGISTLRKPYNPPIIFEPGLEFSMDFAVTDYEYAPVISIEGDLKDTVTVSDLRDYGPDAKAFTVYVKFPEKIETPGIHMIYIGVQEKYPPSATVGGTVRVRKAAPVLVLFETKEIQLSLDAPNMNVDEKKDITLRVSSWSKQVITSVNAEIEILDSDLNVVKTIITDTKSVNPGKTVELYAELDTSGFKPGTYTAKAKVHYDGNEKTIEDSMNIGTLTVHLVKYTKYFEKTKVNPIVVEVESGWNNPVKNVFAEGFINNTRIFKTVSEDLDPWTRKTLSSFWDPHEYTFGVHKGKIRLNFQGLSKEYDALFYVLTEEQYLNITGQKVVEVQNPSLMTLPNMLLASSFVIVVLAIVVLFMLFRQGRRNE